MQRANAESVDLLIQALPKPFKDPETFTGAALHNDIAAV